MDDNSSPSMQVPLSVLQRLYTTLPDEFRPELESILFPSADTVTSIATMSGVHASLRETSEFSTETRSVIVVGAVSDSDDEIHVVDVEASQVRRVYPENVTLDLTKERAW